MSLNKKDNIFKGNNILLLIKNVLAEDIGRGDVTTEALIGEDVKAVAEISAKQKNFIICGLPLLNEIFTRMDKSIHISYNMKDGDRVNEELIICRINGPARVILKGERTALNFLGRLSAIATQTNKLVKKVSNYPVKILDTRKTTPGLRVLEKYAVRIGGADNHRFGLFDRVLIKDNHIKILKLVNKQAQAGAIIKQARAQVNNRKIVEIEVKNLDEFKAALPANPDIIMLDNMGVKRITAAVQLRDKLNKKVKLEASGNINERNISAIAKCGVDFISLGMLTHSVNNVDFSLNVTKLLK